jgi:hypothetical protein
MKSSIFRDIRLCSTVKVNKVSEEHITSAFRAEEYAKQVLPASSWFCHKILERGGSRLLPQVSILEMLSP